MSLYYWIFSSFWQTTCKFAWEKGVKKLDSLTKEKGDYNVSATTMWGPSSLMRSLTTKNCMGSNWNFALVQKHSWEWKCPQDIFFTYQNVSESQTEYFGNVAAVITWTLTNNSLANQNDEITSHHCLPSLFFIVPILWCWMGP